MLLVFGVAAQLAIVAHVPDTVAACDAVELSVAASARGGDTPRIIAPSFAPFDVLRVGAPVMHWDGRSMTVEASFVITTDRAGRFVIPAFEARTASGRALSAALPIVVRPPRGRAVPVVVTRARVDTAAELDVRMTAAAETVYVGQQATYEVAVFLNQAVRDRLRRNPTFYPPEMQAMLAYDLPAPLSAMRPRGGSQCFDALVYRRALFPLVPGRVVIPPAQLVYNTGLSPMMYTREESHELQTDSVSIIAVDPPVAGRPPEYAGAVGDLRLETRLDSTVSRVGDPMLLTVRVTGRGNVKLFPRPAVDLSWAGLIPADERVQVDSSSARISGSKEFDWVVTPRLAGEFDLPPIRYGYFDPGRRRYGVARSDALKVRVVQGALASADTGSAESTLGIRMRYSGASWPPVHTQPAFWLALALVPLPALVSRARRRSAVARRQPADAARALLTGPLSNDPVALRRNYVRGMAARIGCSPEDFTHPGALERALLRAGVSHDTAHRAEMLLRQLDAAAYAATRATPANAAQEARTIARAVDDEALARSELPFWIPVVVAATLLTFAGAAIAADLAGARFARGVSAYVSRDYSAARDAFAAAATLEPGSPDAWANYGTASWTLADTASAVLGWRQALAIDPAAEDLQERITLPRDEGPMAPGWVPSVPRDSATWLFVLLWVAGWALAFQVSRRSVRSSFARWPAPLLVTSLVVGLVAIEAQSRISGERLAVVRAAGAMSSDPAIGMDRGPALATGELVRVNGRRGSWMLIEASGDREGWVESARLLPLEDRRVPRN